MIDPPECPTNELHHYVCEWIQRGFCDPKGNLYAFRPDDGKLFRTGPPALYARNNQNTAWSEDPRRLLAYSENSYRYLDGGAARSLQAVRDAARQASWSVNATSVSGITAELTSWIRAAVLMQYVRTAIILQDWSAIAETHGLNAVERGVLEVAAAVRRPQQMEAALRDWSLIVYRSAPHDPFILGDNIVLFGLPMTLPTDRDAQQEVPFVGILVDQHTIIGFTEPAYYWFHGEPGRAEVVRLSTPVVDNVCRQVARNATTIAASSVVRVETFGKPECERRQNETEAALSASAEPLIGGLCQRTPSACLAQRTETDPADLTRPFLSTPGTEGHVILHAEPHPSPKVLPPAILRYLRGRV